ncbi:hypothetical protein ADIMK_1362 [Marinobacterium lacunae]|uniref:Uncharacterized protein n=1 Tax=Marinobacterium lacunae TaxID=1232683 RepID=A0A081G103_9GAMM|nr:hypothetical protein ADIMK_1362 [Marinobacterium lacunae]
MGGNRLDAHLALPLSHRLLLGIVCKGRCHMRHGYFSFVTSLVL